MIERLYHNEWYCPKCHGKIVCDVDRASGETMVSVPDASCDDVLQCATNAAEKCGFSGFTEEAHD